MRKMGNDIPLAELRGQIERITFTNEENGYTVAKVKVYGRSELVPVLGNLMSPTPGAILKMWGKWSTHPKFGEQFEVIRYETQVPATEHGIEKYLGSGLIKGVGPKMAKRIVKMFKAETLDIIESNIERLAEVPGIGKKRIAMITKAWEEQKEIRNVMLFLQSHGVSAGYATKIFKQYGKESIKVVTENPYRLAMDIFGIGFVTADKIAEKLGFAKDSILRAQAGILYVLHKLADEGHVYYPYEELVEKSMELLGVEREVITEALGAIALEKRIVIEDLNESLESFRENNKAVYLAKYHLCETRIARRLMGLTASAGVFPKNEVENALGWVQGELDFSLAENQRRAVKSALENKVMVITGGPGTGKTTIINAVLKIYTKMQVRILLAAPTGRAAKRMGEATGHPAKTIHRLLSFSFAAGGFQHNAEKPLACDLLILDEASMIDTVLMHHLLKAVPPEATLILVGDVHQLPSVGAGNVLGDIIASAALPVVTLNEIFRQARKSRIIVNAHKINSGKIPGRENDLSGSDFFFIEQEDPEKVLSTILTLARERIPARFGFDPVDQIQVLTPMHRGVVGAGNLNTRLQEVLNPGSGGLVRGERAFRRGDKVMQIRNNYDKDVFNGDMGRIAGINREEQEVMVDYEGRLVAYDFSEMDEVVLAYAVSVHKSQGSEYPVVVMPVLIQHYMLLQRNLIYTGVTRGRKLVVLVGTRKAMAIAVNNNKTGRRFTHLKDRLYSEGAALVL